jgi:hypothetical protein
VVGIGRQHRLGPASRGKISQKNLPPRLKGALLLALFVLLNELGPCLLKTLTAPVKTHRPIIFLYRKIENLLIPLCGKDR